FPCAVAVLAWAAALPHPAARAGEPVVRVGSGSYATRPAPGGKEPPRVIYKTDAVRGPVPTSKWWSSLAWAKFSRPQYAHPLALRTTPAGLAVYYPGPSITANKVGIFGDMPGDGTDLVLGHAQQP